ncbi:MAG: transferrin-binding protein-like solute binding protein [Nitrospira sp.]|nr:transferrin-binding protein-like solute binding protein [Nitrospira sp.]MDE0406086.1 transferrin-binding protein-like solute binding protein [Nitrospira sp.]
MRRCRFLVAMGFVLVLSGCGGSGFLPMMGEPLDLETARSERSAVGAVRNSLLVSDLVFAPGNSQGERIRGHTSCGRTTCRSTILGQPYLRISLGTSAEAEGSGFFAGEPIVSALERYRGVALGAFFRTDRLRTEHVEVDTDILSYEGWMQYSSFGAELNTITHGIISYGDFQRVLTGERYGLASSSGMATGTNPVDGSATWTGVVIGGRISHDALVGIGVRGHATLTYDFMNENIDVFLTNVQNSQPEVDGRQIYPNMTWQNLPVRDGRFGADFDAPDLEGRFYGPNHEEVGGIFERNQIIGAFGAKR